MYSDRFIYIQKLRKTCIMVIKYYNGLDHLIDSPTKCRTYDTLISTSVSIFLQKVGLMIHWS